MKSGCYPLIVFLVIFATVSTWAQTPVEVESAVVRTISEQIEVSGTVTSPRTATLSTAVAGQVVDISVDEGLRVEKGEAVLSLDAELAGLALERSKLEVRQRETVLADAKRRLGEAESIGPERGVARTQIDLLRAEVANIEASLAVLEVNVREQVAVVARHRVVAPFSGVIRERFTELGEWVNPGDGLFELVAMDNLRFDFRVSQNMFGRIKPDTAVNMTVQGQELRGKVSAIVPIRDAGSRTFLVRVLSDDSQSTGSSAISPGMSASAKIGLDSGRTGIAVSRDAVLRFSDGRMSVWVVESLDGVTSVRAQAIQSGLEFDGFVEIKEGLKAGDRVVSRGNESLQEGQAVTILNSGS